MNFEYQLNSTDRDEACLVALNGSSKSENQTLHKWVLLIGVFFVLMGIISQDKRFLVVGIVLVTAPIFCKLFVKKDREELYEMYDRKSDISLDREIPNIANQTN